MKKWMAYALLLLLSLACVQELDVPRPDSEVGTEGKVRITFAVPEVPVKPATKALGEDVELHELYVAVFGRNHYLKEYVKAHSLGYRRDQNNQLVYYSYPVSDEETVSVKVIQFTVTLSMSDSKRYLHFLLNGPGFLPYGTDKSILPSLTTDDQAYWQMVELDHIGAEVEDGQYVLDDPNVPSIYKPDDYTKKMLGGNVEDINVEGKDYKPVALIRNFAKITVTADVKETSHFVPKTFALYNAPERGTYVPFDYANGFISQYETMDYGTLHDVKNYTGNFVIQGNTLVSDLPSNYSFRDPLRYPDSRVIPIAHPTGDGENAPAYMFERSIPTTEALPTALIVYGSYYKENSETGDLEYVNDYFYRIDLMEKVRDPNTYKMVGQYYPIYRNIQYQVQIGKIGSIGHETPEAAAASIGSADVSSSITTRHLTDISNGIERLIVSPWLSHTLTQEETNYNLLSFVYYQDLSEDPYCGPAVVNDETILSVAALPMSQQGLTPVISEIRFDDGAIDPGETKGYRTITFSTNENSRVSRSQTIRISAGNLYRDVVITLQEKRQMEVTCHVPNDTRSTLWQADKELEVDITVPNDLVSSMFPLQFILEPEKMTLTPDVSKSDNNLPVTSGPSIADETKTAFHFTRTVTLEEYRNQPVEERMDEEGNVSRYKTFKCYFTPTRARSATTIWVTEENGFFELASTEFYNYPYFENLTWSHSGQRIPSGAGHVAFSFHVDKDETGHYPVIFFTPTGLTDLPSAWNLDSEGVYTYQPEDFSDGNITFNCSTTANHGGNVQVKLSAYGYEEGLLVAKHFQQARFINGQNYVSGYVVQPKSKTVKFGYYDEPGFVNNLEDYAEITVMNVTGMTPSGMTSLGGGHWKWKPTSRQNTTDKAGLAYHEISFSTTTAGDYPQFTLTSPGYVDATFTTSGRCGGDIINYNNQFVIKTSNEFVAGNLDSFINGNEGKGRRIRIYTNDSYYTYCYVKFNSISSIDKNGVNLGASANPYELSISTDRQDGNDDRLFYVAVTFTTGHHPQQCQPSVGSFDEYPATANMYIWTLPVTSYSGTLQLTAPPEGIVIQSISIRTFRQSGTGFVPAP